MPFAGMGYLEYVDNQFLAAQLQAQQHIGTNSYVLLTIVGGQQADKLTRIFDGKTLIGCQASYYLNTMFGPVGGSIGYNTRARKVYWYINLGFEF